MNYFSTLTKISIVIFFKKSCKISTLGLLFNLFSCSLFAQNITASKMIEFQSNDASYFTSQTKKMGFTVNKEVSEPVIGTSLKYRIEMGRLIENGDEALTYRINNNNSVKINFTTSILLGNIVFKQFKMMGFKYTSDYVDTDYATGTHYYIYSNGKLTITTAEDSGLRFLYLQPIR